MSRNRQNVIVYFYNLLLIVCFLACFTTCQFVSNVGDELDGNASAAAYSTPLVLLQNLGLSSLLGRPVISRCWGWTVSGGRGHFSNIWHNWLAREFKVPQSRMLQCLLSTVQLVLHNKQLLIYKYFRWLTVIQTAFTNPLWLLFTVGNHPPIPPLESYFVLE